MGTLDSSVIALALSFLRINFPLSLPLDELEQRSRESSNFDIILTFIVLMLLTSRRLDVEQTESLINDSVHGEENKTNREDEIET